MEMMETLKELSPLVTLFVGGIFYTAFLAFVVSFFSVILGFALRPIRKDIAKLETDVQGLKAGQAKLEKGQEDLKTQVSLLIEAVASLKK